MAEYVYRDLVSGIYVRTADPDRDPWRYVLVHGSADGAGWADEDDDEGDEDGCCGAFTLDSDCQSRYAAWGDDDES